LWPDTGAKQLSRKADGLGLWAVTIPAAAPCDRPLRYAKRTSAAISQKEIATFLKTQKGTVRKYGGI